MSAVERFWFCWNPYEGAHMAPVRNEREDGWRDLYVRHSDHALLEAKYNAALRRVDELETMVAMADVMAQRIAKAPVFHDDGSGPALYVALSMLAGLRGKHVALAVLEDHESGGEGSK